jgi:hypothetical protein
MLVPYHTRFALACGTDSGGMALGDTAEILGEEDVVVVTAERTQPAARGLRGVEPSPNRAHQKC